MGMFDSVLAPCKRPGCNGYVEWQTKVGPCNMDRWEPREAPSEILRGIHNTTGYCAVCGNESTFRLTHLPYEYD